MSDKKEFYKKLKVQLEDQKDIAQDIELLSSQVERCNQILKKLTLNPNHEDEFIDENFSIRDYLKEIVSSFKETSNKSFILDFDKGFFNPPNSTVPTTLSPCSIGVIPNPLF